jgi:two-component system, LytTR family, response regulator
MNVLIIEDEVPAAEKLERYLAKYDSRVNVIAKLDSVESSVAFLKEHYQAIDLIFMDIQLIDGLSFQIFQQVEVKKPVIFTTAFNEYALDAFKVNSIDYLLKPITFTDLSASLKKFNDLKSHFQLSGDLHEKLKDSVSIKKTFKNRFMVKLGEHIRSVTTDHIVLFYAEGRDAYLLTTQNRKFIIDYTLESLEELLDPTIFFRLNRTFIININSIKDVLVYSNSRLKIILNQEFDKEIIVSRENVRK